MAKLNGEFLRGRKAEEWRRNCESQVSLNARLIAILGGGERSQKQKNKVVAYNALLAGELWKDSIRCYSMQLCRGRTCDLEK